MKLQVVIAFAIMAWALAVQGSGNRGCQNPVFIEGPYNGQSHLYNATAADLSSADGYIGPKPDSGAFFAVVAVTVGSKLTLSTCNTDTEIDTVLDVYTGSDCESLEYVIGNDDATCSVSQFASVLSLITTEDTYWVKVTSNEYDGQFGLTISEIVPNVADNGCVNAEILYGPFTTPVTVTGTINSTTSYDQPCYASSSVVGNWYLLYPTVGAVLSVSTCGNYKGIDDTIMVLAGGQCDDLQCISEYDDTCGRGSRRSSAEFTAVEDYYYVYISGVGAYNHGYYELTVSETLPQSPPTAPPGTNCQNPYPLPGAGHYFGFSTVDTDSAHLCNITSAPTFWFSIYVSTGNDFSISTCSSGTDFHTFAAIYSDRANCNLGECVLHNSGQYNCIYGNQMAVTPPVPGSNLVSPFLIAITGVAGAVGNFDLIVSY